MEDQPRPPADRKRYPIEQSLLDNVVMTTFAERELTETERNAVRWLLKHGKDTARQYLLHADRITVIDVCPCGYASIDFALDGMRPKPAGMEIISDHYWVDDNNNTGGVLLFTVSGQLAGLEVY